MSIFKREVVNFHYKVFSKILTYFGYSLIDKNFLGIYKNLYKKYGWGESVKTQKPIDCESMELPWFTFPAIEYLSQIDMRSFDIYEWGSGNSSKYFARRCQSIISIESNSDWFDFGVKNLEKNQKIYLLNSEEYVEAINRDNKMYDVIVIDGVVRYECAQAALKNIKEAGVIILDNSDWYPNTCKLLRGALRFIQVDFHGFGPINSYSWTTSLFIGRSTNLKYLGGRQPHYSKAAIVQVSSFDEIV